MSSLVAAALQKPEQEWLDPCFIIRWTKRRIQEGNDASASTKPESCSDYFSCRFKLNHLNCISTHIKISTRKHRCVHVQAKTLVCPPSIPSCSSCMTTAALTLPNHIRHLKSPGSPLPITGENKNCNAAFLLLATAPSSSLWCMSAVIRFPAADGNTHTHTHIHLDTLRHTHWHTVQWWAIGWRSVE